MNAEEITSLVLQMKPPVFGKSNTIRWMIKKAAEIGIATAYASILKQTTFNKYWK